MFSVARRATTQIPKTFAQQVRTHYSDMPSTPENNTITNILMGVAGLCLAAKTLHTQEISDHLKLNRLQIKGSWTDSLQEVNKDLHQR